MVVELLDADSGRQVRSDLVQSSLHPLDGFQGIAAVLLLDGDRDSGLTVIAGVVSAELPSDADIGDISHVHGDVVAGGDDRIGYVVDACDAAESLDELLLGAQGQDAS